MSVMLTFSSISPVPCLIEIARKMGIAFWMEAYVKLDATSATTSTSFSSEIVVAVATSRFNSDKIPRSPVATLCSQ